MKRMFAILCLSGILATVGNSQDVNYSFQFTNVSFEDVLEEISKATGYRFIYVREILPDTRISDSWSGIEVENLLEVILEDELLGYEVNDDKTITLFPLRSLTSPFQLFGRVTDAETGEFLAGTNVFTNSYQGVTTDPYGLYSIEVDPVRDSVLSYSYLGYQSSVVPIREILEGRRDVSLNPDLSMLAEVTITNQTPPGQLHVSNPNILSSPTYPASRSISGSIDIFEFLNATPGVVKMSEGRTGFSVNGCATDQNLILIDEAPVFNPSHALGFLSVFNNDALNSATFQKNAISSKYGGRLSSVLDIRMREGNSNHIAARLGTNPFYSGLTLDGPILKNKLSFLVSGRHSHMNYLIGGFETKNNFYVPKTIDFYDVHGKINLKLGNNNRIYASSFFNQDAISPQKNPEEIQFYDTNWKNRTFTFRWNSIWNDKIFTNTSFIFSDYQYVKSATADTTGQRFEEQSQISNSHIKFELNYHVTKIQKLLAGINYTSYTFNPGSGFIDLPSDSARLEYDIANIKSKELAFFVEDQVKLGSGFNVDIGIRYSHFFDVGNGTYEFTYDDNGEIIDSLFRQKNKVIRSFTNMEPRVNVEWQLNEKLVLQSSWSRTSQYIIRLLNDNPTTPNEYWIPAGQQVDPLTSNIFSVSLHKYQSEHSSFRTALFWRKSKNVTAFRNGTSIFFSEALIDRQITQGEFRSYGLEVSYSKKFSSFSYQANYTISDAKVKFPDIDEGQWYNAPQNYRHDLNFQGTYLLSPRVTLYANWQWRSGDLISLPTGIGYFSGFPFEIYTERNNYRLGNYHRLDLSANWVALESTDWKMDLSFGVYNLTGQLNPFQVAISPGATNPRIEVMALTRMTPFLHLQIRYR